MAPLLSSSSSRNRSKLLIVLAAILTLTVFLLSTRKQNNTPSSWTHRRLHTTSRLIHSIAASHCDTTIYPDLCISTLLSIPDLPNKSLPAVLTAVVNHTADAVISSSRNCSTILRYNHRRLDPRQRLALSDCIELLDATLDDLRLASQDLRSSLRRRRLSYRADLATVLSAAITNQFTCLDGFAFTPNAESIRPKIQHRLVHISRLVSNALAMSKKIPPSIESSGAFEEYENLKGDGFPTWLGKMDQQILQAPAPAPGPTPEGLLMPDLVVAKDGSGNFTTVGEAVAAAPNNSATRFVIYIKEGGYFENVEVGKNKINMIWIGDGIGRLSSSPAGTSSTDGPLSDPPPSLSSERVSSPGT
ncbi:hypothetical protein HPP92_013730 [Vanilla planifolia]|uniref:Pectinesterase inhibitor domain-containing protein n=1 Tax=Vanilla planifolia TaxID=51239 RepID=A0A835UV26_VANPL|nr:hypothetical protein HPP92_013730 [Vanilla planifolia]